MAKYTSKVVQIGQLMLGGDHPIRVQSMTNTNTLDTQSTVDQVIQLANAGCELVRITAPGIKEAENLRIIKKSLYDKGINIPLIADIHFNPKAAEVAATIVEKVRINPGNYIDANMNLAGLVRTCRQYGTAIRIGVNQGSLSSDIINRYGDTVEGMVMSALEYARLFADLNFENLILSVKSSNPVIMTEAYRQLADVLLMEGLNYPLHIGVTEAGNGQEGRMKSCVGIGTVLSYGIGDTVRVSLTEDPIKEIPLARELVRRFTQNHNGIRIIRPDILLTNISSLDASTINSGLSIDNKKKVLAGLNPFMLLIREGDNYWICNEKDSFTLMERSKLMVVSNNQQASVVLGNGLQDDIGLIIQLPAGDALNFIRQLRHKGTNNPLYLMSHQKASNIEELIIENCIHPGSLILNGLAQGLCLDSLGNSLNDIAEIGFNLLQATRARISKAEYIACPSCGRTQFDIEKRLEEVKAATSHFKGLKIAVMGCIVNGPGEMADADYGYVGAGRGKVTLYKGKLVVKHSVPEQQAVNELLDIIEKDKRSES